MENISQMAATITRFTSGQQTVQPDILGITESWTHDGILDAELSYDDYTLFRCDRPCDRRGGGVLLYVRNK